MAAITPSRPSIAKIPPLAVIEAEIARRARLREIAMIAALPQDQRESLQAGFSPAEIDELRYEWRFWGRPAQFAPSGAWDTWLMLAGRGFGKTEAGAQWIRERVAAGARNIALVGETQKDLEEVMVARLVSIHPPKEAPSVRYKPVRLVWPNGAVALGYNGTEPDQLRGPEFDTAWVDELAKYRDAQETWDMLQFTMRSGPDPRVLVTTTPRPIEIVRAIAADSHTKITGGSTFENAANLPSQFLEKIRQRYEGTRLGRQELHAEILDDLLGEYFKSEWFISVDAIPPRDSLRVYGGSDYAVTSNGGDYTVHAVLGLDVDGNPWLLDLWRKQAASDEWVVALCELVKKWKPMAWAEESGQIKSGVGPFLEREMRSRKAYTAREQFPTKGDKAVRAQSFRGLIATRGLRIPSDASWRGDFESELLCFPAGVHDDAVDACGLIGQLLDKMLDGPSAIKPEVKARDDYRESRSVEHDEALDIMIL
jgi:predicted phage terminase large subunit-like protein